MPGALKVLNASCPPFVPRAREPPNYHQTQAAQSQQTRKMPEIRMPSAKPPGSHFAKLPVEVLDRIFEYLDPSRLHKLCQVARFTWKSAIQQLHRRIRITSRNVVLLLYRVVQNPDAWTRLRHVHLEVDWDVPDTVISALGILLYHECAQDALENVVARARCGESNRQPTSAGLYPSYVLNMLPASIRHVELLATADTLPILLLPGGFIDILAADSKLLPNLVGLQITTVLLVEGNEFCIYNEKWKDAFLQSRSIEISSGYVRRS